MKKLTGVKLYTGEAYFPDGCVVTDADRVLYAGALDGCPDYGAMDEEIDGAGGIVMNALYNAHTHAAMTLMRGVGSDLALMDWLGKVMPIESQLDGEMVYWGTMLSIMEMIRRGTAGFADMYFYMERVAEAVAQTGVRAYLCRGSSNEEGVASNAALFRDWHGAANGRVRICMGLHAEYTSTPEIARNAIEQASRIGAGMHVHMSETRGEVEDCIKRHGVTPVKYFSDMGMFALPTLAAHCVHLSAEDRALLSRGGVWAAHNPISNMKLASGVADIRAMQRDGVRIALGNDGASSNNTLCMFTEMRMAALIQKGFNLDATALSAPQVIEMATRGGALAMGFDECGLIRPGMKADLILLDAQAENLLPVSDAAAAIVYAAQGLNVRMTMVDGDILYRDGEFTTLDEQRVRARFMESARALGTWRD